MRCGVMLLFPLLSLGILSTPCTAREHGPADTSGMAVIIAADRREPPAWAVMQRNLIRAMNEAAPLYYERFTWPGGTMRGHGKLDDDYECFFTWPLFYALGGDEDVLDRSLDAWNGITRQWTYQHNQSVKEEFVKQNDMLHLSEGYVGFQYYGLADPSITENIERARRFVGFYLGVNPEARNYDPEHHLIRSPITGSAGPATTGSADYVLIYGHASLYPVMKSLESGWEKDTKRHEEIQRLYDDLVISGDVPMNLAVTGLFSHAAILTGDEKYKKWVLDYVDAWMERTSENGGVIPDNVGISGKIGEKRNGQWWGGFFGWTGRYSVEMIFNSLITASECAYLLSGDTKYLGFLRSQVDMLLDKSIVREGNLLVPYKVGPEGWFDYRPLGDYILSHLWKASMSPDDWTRVARVRDGKKNGPWEYFYADSPNPPLSPDAEMWHPDSTRFDWSLVQSDLRGNQQRRNEAPHVSYLAGTNPGWPEDVLQAEYENVARAVERIRSGTWRHDWASQTILLQNPVFTNALAQTTTGAPFTCYNGGLLMARLRYFDPDNARPGLPEDVAALVEKMEADRTVVQLVNTGVRNTRRVIVQGGAYGEHDFTNVRYSENGAERDITVNKNCFVVELRSGTCVELDIGTKRFTNRPTYKFPWK